MINTKRCLICKRPNDTLYWHSDEEKGDIWCWCNGTCQRGYSLHHYCDRASISLPTFLKNEFYFEESAPNEVNKMEWPVHFLPLSDPRAKPGVDYIVSRGLDARGDMYYDADRHAIVFPYYFNNIYVGAQVRFIEPEDDHKMETVPGTRTGLLFYGWNQGKFVTNIRGMVVTEGAFNALSLQQALDELYGGVANNPWKCMASSGAGSSSHQIEAIKELKDNGCKVIAAPDFDEAGQKMLSKLLRGEAITHYAFTMSRETDWNDLGQKLGKKDLAKFFLQSIKKVS